MVGGLGVMMSEGTWQDICKGSTFAHVPPPTQALVARGLIFAETREAGVFDESRHKKEAAFYER